MDAKSGILLGSICGVGTILFLIICYWIDSSFLYNPVITYSTWLPLLICMFLSIAIEKSKRKVAFKEALRNSFVCFIISVGLYYIFDYIMKGYVDPDLVHQMELAYLEEIKSYLPSSNSNSIDFTPRISDYLYTFASSLIVGFIISFILAYILKDE